MEVEYKKDLRNNYMVIKGEDYEEERYSIKMMEYQSLQGLLALNHKCLDNRVLYYYDITAKQSMFHYFDKTVLSYERLKKIISRILSVIDEVYNYLLNEDNFILQPDYIYLDVTTDEPYLCYYPGYQKNIKEQMNGLIEFLMNKVDYHDKDAVLLVYQLYSVSREEHFTFEQLNNLLNKQIEEMVPDNVKGKREPASTRKYEKTEEEYFTQRNEKMKKSMETTVLQKNSVKQKGILQQANTIQSKRTINRIKAKSDIPVMLERIEDEVEINTYPPATYLYTLLCLTGGVMIVIAAITSGILYNQFGNRMDYTKVCALLLILICTEGYFLKKIWDKKNKQARITPRKSYINPREDQEDPSSLHCDEKDEPEEDDILPEQVDVHEQAGLRASVFLRNTTQSQQEESYDSNPTCFLNEEAINNIGEDALNPCINENKEQKEFMLKPVDEINYSTISITDFPFFIGKLKKNVDYCLKNDVVSRYHAKITKEQDQFYITDLNSTNGTYVNQEILQSYQKKEIQLGDEVAFANIRYIFLYDLC